MCPEGGELSKPAALHEIHELVEAAPKRRNLTCTQARPRCPSGGVRIGEGEIQSVAFIEDLCLRIPHSHGWAWVRLLCEERAVPFIELEELAVQGGASGDGVALPEEEVLQGRAVLPEVGQRARGRRSIATHNWRSVAAHRADVAMRVGGCGDTVPIAA